MNRSSRLQIYLELGRVSNLPTVWTNVCAGAYLAGGDAPPSARTVAALAIALSAFYVGGMYLNDAFDCVVDAKERPERPIPSGRIGAGRVFAIGFALLGSGIVSIATIALSEPRASLAAVFAALGLAATVVVYDAWHKANPASPLVMALCRAFVYGTAALGATGACPTPVLVGAGALFAYIAGLTYVAKQENLSSPKNLWPLAILAVPALIVLDAARSGVVGLALAFGFAGAVGRALQLLAGTEPKRTPRAVTLLIAGVALLDGALLARGGHPFAAVAAAAGFFVTRRLQRVVAGT